MAGRAVAGIDNDPNQDFLQALNGQFCGLLRWEQFDALRETLDRNASGWFVYATDDPPPTLPHAPEAFRSFVGTLFKRLRDDSPNSCSFIYADNLAQPSLVKIYHPKKLIACGIGSTPPVPAWIFSKIPPVEIIRESRRPASRWKRFRLF